MECCDFLVIGGGIAGAATAYRLAPHGSVVMLERESQPGYHTTGRSGALYSERYANPVIRGLAAASGAFLRDPPAGFAQAPLLAPRGLLYIARPDQTDALARQFVPAQYEAGIVRDVTVDEAMTLVPCLDRDYFTAAAHVPAAKDIDVNGLHQGFLRGIRQAGGRMVTDAEVIGLARDDAGWTVRTTAGDFAAAVVVNGAGAWADTIAGLAGVRPVGLQPMRRTVVTFDPPDDVDPSSWAFLFDAEEEFYFKPESGRILLSPADETPMEPHDAFPEELDIAIAVDRLERCSTLRVTHIRHRWAGLRSFVRDRMPVAGTAPDAPGFVWLAGQGGFGIMTAEALGRVAAAAALGAPFPDDLAALGLGAERLSPARVQ